MNDPDLKSYTRQVVNILITCLCLGIFLYYTATLILPEKWLHKQTVTTTHVIIPPISVANQTLDASLGSEFILTLTSNVNLGIIHMVDGRALNLTVTNAEHSLIFTNQILWLPTNTIPYAVSNDITCYTFFQNSNIIYGSVMRRIRMEVDESTNWVASGSSNVWGLTNVVSFTSNINYCVMFDNATSNVWIWRDGVWAEYEKKKDSLTNHLTN